MSYEVVTDQAPAVSEHVSISIPETLMSSEMLDMAAKFANHELKAFALLYVASLGMAHKFGKELGDGFIGFMGPELEHDVGGALMYTLCSDTLEECGFLERSYGNNGRGRIAIGFGIIERGVEYLPLAGALLDWGLKYPEISTQQVLGPTQSPTEHIAARNRLNLLLHMLTVPSLPVSTTEIIDSMGHVVGTEEHVVNRADVTVAVHGLEKDGLVTVVEAATRDDHEFEIVTADMPPVEGISRIGPIGRSLCGFLTAEESASILAQDSPAVRPWDE